MSTPVNHYSHQFILGGLGYLPADHKLTLSWNHAVREAMLHWQQHLGMPTTGLPLEVNVVPPAGTEWMYSAEGYVLIPGDKLPDSFARDDYVASLLGAFRDLQGRTEGDEPQTFETLGYREYAQKVTAMPDAEQQQPDGAEVPPVNAGPVKHADSLEGGTFPGDEAVKTKDVSAESAFGADTTAGTPAAIPSTEPDRTVEQAKEAAPTPLPVDPVVPISPAGEPGQVKQGEANESKEAAVDPSLGVQGEKGPPGIAGAYPTDKKVEAAPTAAKPEAPARAVRPTRK